jgi:hypothetical protein
MRRDQIADRSMGLVARVFQPSTLRMLVWPDAAQNNMAAVSADGSTVCVCNPFDFQELVV